MSTVPHLKACVVCGVAKPLSEYHRNRAASDGCDTRCKACKRAHYQQNRDTEILRRRENYRQQREQRLAYFRARRETRRDDLRAYQREHYRQHRQHIREERQAWRAAHPEEVRAWKRREYLKNRERHLIRSRQWRRNNREHGNAYRREYWRQRPIANRLKAHRRRLIVVAAGPQLTPAAWAAMCEWFGGVCVCCGTAGVLTMDHVVPVSQGGTNDARNIQPLCRPCNSRKGARVVDYRNPERLCSFLEAFGL